MAIYYFNVRDEFGLIEDPDGLEMPDTFALLLEALRSADEFIRDARVTYQMRLEITDAQGKTVFMTPVQERLLTWNYLVDLSMAPDDIH